MQAVVGERCGKGGREEGGCISRKEGKNEREREREGRITIAINERQKQMEEGPGRRRRDGRECGRRDDDGVVVSFPAHDPKNLDIQHAGRQLDKRRLAEAWPATNRRN